MNGTCIRCDTNPAVDYCFWCQECINRDRDAVAAGLFPKERVQGEFK